MPPADRDRPGFQAWLKRRARALYHGIEPGRREIARMKNADIALFQPWPYTLADRYPDLFRHLAEGLSEIEGPRILSFGCASGEEVRSMRSCCPGAEITGIDCNRRALAKARRRDSHPLSRYIESDRPDPGAEYDAVLALAVFRHGSMRSALPPQNCQEIMPFCAVDDAVARLDAVLVPGGWLGWANNHFQFEDMRVAEKYLPGSAAGKPTRPDPLYDRSNTLVTTSRRPPMLYRKK